MEAAKELSENVGVKPACESLSACRAVTGSQRHGNQFTVVA
jgi:hypothetical protein